MRECFERGNLTQRRLGGGEKLPLAPAGQVAEALCDLAKRLTIDVLGEIECR
jgi:hypothetical protein